MTEIVDVISLAHFTDTRIGAVSRKQRFRVPIQVAEELEALGLIAPINPTPTTAIESPQTEALAVGGGELSQLLPVDQASQKQTATLSCDKDGKQSPSTTATVAPHLQMSSMPATMIGGKSTQIESALTSKAKGGRKTTMRQKSTD